MYFCTIRELVEVLSARVSQRCCCVDIERFQHDRLLARGITASRGGGRGFSGDDAAAPKMAGIKSYEDASQQEGYYRCD